MTGAAIEIRVDSDKVSAGLSQLLSRLENPDGFLRGVSEELTNSTKDRFETQTDPDGLPWQHLSPTTVIKRLSEGAVPLNILRSNKSGAASLSASIRPYYGQGWGGVATVTPHAAIHQFGGTINRPARVGKVFNHKKASVRAYTIRIPARPFLGLSEDDRIAIIELADEWLSFD